MLEYKGYRAEFEFDKDTNYWCGWLYGIKDLVTFGGETKEDAEKDFYVAVEDYLEFCKALNQEPDREEVKLSNIEIKDDLYQSLLSVAKNTGESLNILVEKILTGYLAKSA